MKHNLILLAVACLPLSSIAQTAEDSVKTTVNTLFNAMKNSDTELLKSVFADSAILQTIVRNKEGKTVVQTERVADFAEQVSKIPKDAADERITFDVVRVDGALAIAWTPYRFYFNGKFSHCGANSFQLVRFNGVWKIQYLIDTRRRAGCEP